MFQFGTLQLGVVFAKNLALVALYDRGPFVGGGSTNVNPIDYSKSNILGIIFSVLKFLPEPIEVSCPKFVPEIIASAFIEAETAFNASLYSSAAAL